MVKGHAGNVCNQRFSFWQDPQNVGSGEVEVLRPGSGNQADKLLVVRANEWVRRIDHTRVGLVHDPRIRDCESGLHGLRPVNVN